MTAQPAFDPDAAAENSRRKAGPIGVYAWRHALTFADLGRLPYVDRDDRGAPSLRRFAAAAYRAAAVAENVPGSRTSDTWRYVRDVLADLEDRAATGAEGVPARDLAGDRDRWQPRPRAIVDVELPDPGEPPDDPPDKMPADIPADDHGDNISAAGTPPPVELTVGDREVAVAVAFGDLAEGRRVTPLTPASPPRRVRPVDLVPYTAPPALVTFGSPPLRPGETIPDGPPRGWAALAALGPLTHPGAVCRWCGAPALVGTPNGWRCVDHPPRRRDPLGDWGWSLNWAPKPGRVCLAVVCYCGRCAHYDPTCTAPPPRRSV